MTKGDAPTLRRINAYVIEYKKDGKFELMPSRYIENPPRTRLRAPKMSQLKPGDSVWYRHDPGYHDEDGDPLSGPKEAIVTHRFLVTGKSAVYYLVELLGSYREAADDNWYCAFDVRCGDQLTRRKTCWACDSTVDKLFHCSTCKCALYCSKACQRRDWADEHKRECPAFAKLRMK